MMIYGVTTLRNVLDRLSYLEPYPDLQCDGVLLGYVSTGQIWGAERGGFSARGYLKVPIRYATSAH